ncbi:MAG TPA: dihydrolipoamide acetyltransferase family protein, partial [Candidatus Limnocylindrales bacterium]|nr:dihydrolipoamide acetyltransferase family protein [Candidatus Limnocylindrales bacterium]
RPRDPEERPVAKVTMPQLGESVAEGTIGKWLKQPGDTVEKYEPLLEVITDKVNAEVPSPFAGVLKEILVEEGATVPNNAEIAVIETADDSAGGTAEAPAPAETAPAGAKAESSPANAEPTTTAAAPEAPTFVPAHGPAGSDERPERAAASAAAPTAVAAGARDAAAELGEAPGNPDARMTPAVRRLLREHGVTAAQIVGTGGGGRITREDVTNYVESQRTGQSVGGQSVGGAQAQTAAASSNGSAATPTPAAPAPAAPTPAASSAAGPATTPASVPSTRSRGIEFPAGSDEVLVPTTQMRKGIAAQMTKALQAPHAYVQMEIDVTRLVAFREKNKRDYQAREGIGLSFVPFVVKAAAEALKRNPTFNAHWTEQGLMAKRRVNVGVAVAVDEGLIVPVIRDADQLSIHGLNAAIADVAARAKAGKFKIDDFGGGTFTVDNTGYLGTNLVMPILNVPEVGIVTMEAITKRPVVVSTPDGDVIAIRPVMNMVLGVDHRANDGAGGAALLRDIKTWLEKVGPDTAIY